MQPHQTHVLCRAFRYGADKFPCTLQATLDNQRNAFEPSWRSHGADPSTDLILIIPLGVSRYVPVAPEKRYNLRIIAAMEMLVK